MKNSQSSGQSASLALLGSGILGGLAPIAAKFAIRELPPFTVLFLRLTIMLIVLLPFALRSLPHYLAHWKKLTTVGLLWTGNVGLFIVGIGYTTAVASQLVYAVVPIIVLLENALMGQERLDGRKTLGVAFGVAGAAILILAPSGGALDLGTASGNGLIFLAALSWSMFLVVSKRVSVHVTPLGMTFAAAVVAWAISGVLAGVWEGELVLRTAAQVSLMAWEAVVFLGVVIGAGMMFLYQYGIKHGSTLAAAMTNYIGILVAGIAGLVLLGEVISAVFVAGGLLVLTGVFLTSTLPLLVPSRLRKK